jgi:hypothetical protein
MLRQLTMTPSSLPFISRRLGVWLLAGALLAATLALAVPLFVRLASASNSTARVHLPARIDAFTERDGLAYPLHWLLGTVFNLTPGTAEAAGIQWMKSAAHARSPDEMATAVQGLMAAHTRAGNPAAFDGRVCWAANRQDPRIYEALVGAGLSCVAPR